MLRVLCLARTLFIRIGNPTFRLHTVPPPMNILVYSGDGTARTSLSHTISTLKSLLGHSHDILPVDARTLADDPWSDTCSLLVIPGGRDLPYVRDLAGKANDRVRRYVESGGRYWGICAGAYYASSEIEFEKGDKVMEVCGPRELKFYPGISKGTVFPGFVYNSESGARSVSLALNVDLLKDYPSAPSVPSAIQSYYNGGCHFSQPHLFPSTDVQVLAWYADPDDGRSGPEHPKAAVIQCRVGRGTAILAGVHPEYDPLRLDPKNPHYAASGILERLLAAEDDRKRFVRALLARMGLEPVVFVDHLASTKTAVMENIVPDLTPLYLSSVDTETIRAVAAAIREIGSKDSNDPTFTLVADANDTFRIVPTGVTLPPTRDAEPGEERDPAKEVKTIIVCDTPGSVPTRGETRFFDQADFYTRLREKREREFAGGKWFKFGSYVMYAEVLTSTQTILDKNFEFAQTLPEGLVCTATRQISGRGRGRNSWVSHAGALQFSLLLRHPSDLAHAPVVFIQYLIALAAVDAVRTRPGYEHVPLRLKWPNDIYAEVDEGVENDDGRKENAKVLKKVGGVLVNSSFLKGEFLLVTGCGLNLSNLQPTTSINHIIARYAPGRAPITQEELLADVLVIFERYYQRFRQHGFDDWFMERYYSRWLHSNQLVTLTTHDGVRVRITGITRDFGLLRTVGIEDGDNEQAGAEYTLQPDGNSFDMLKGMISKKT
ncbi:biotin-protein ligase [Endogone sp. FLAS-F59071]|nr:biotin-protein ligase [Endogone sp. FLAS-F59071]|eukprot:RUS22490.1 biotin-protein ligase [Endogone sp. FLAS-F59071]